MPNKRQPPAKRGPTRDNSRNIAVHMTEEQYQRLQKYMKLTSSRNHAVFPEADSRRQDAGESGGSETEYAHRRQYDLLQCPANRL